MTLSVGRCVRLNGQGRKIRVNGVENATGWIEGVDGDWAIVQWDHRPKSETWREHKDYLEAVG
jgi:hypothetical protein